MIYEHVPSFMSQLLHYDEHFHWTYDAVLILACLRTSFSPYIQRSYCLQHLNEDVVKGLLDQSISFSPLIDYVIEEPRFYEAAKAKILASKNMGAKARLYLVYKDEDVFTNIRQTYDPTNNRHTQDILWQCTVECRSEQTAINLVKFVFSRAAPIAENIKVLYEFLNSSGSVIDLKDLFVTKLLESNLYHLGIVYIANYGRDPRVVDWLKDQPIDVILPYIKELDCDQDAYDTCCVIRI